MIIIEGTVGEIDYEDNHMAALAELVDDKDIENDDAFFIRFHSWNESQEHKIIETLPNKRVRVTIEILEA